MSNRKIKQLILNTKQTEVTHSKYQTDSWRQSVDLVEKKL